MKPKQETPEQPKQDSDNAVSQEAAKVDEEEAERRTLQRTAGKQFSRPGTEKRGIHGN